MSDLVERLRTGKTDGTDLRWTVTPVHREAADEISRLRVEVARCHARLEIDRVFVMGDGDEMIREAVPEDERLSMPDGIDTRNATIRVLDERCDRLRALNAELVEALEYVWDKVLTEYYNEESPIREKVYRALTRAKGEA